MRLLCRQTRPRTKRAGAAEEGRRTVNSLSLLATPLKAEVQVLDAADLLTTVFAMLGFSARAAGVRLILDTPLRGVRLLGDRELLLDVLLTLATDAIEATAPGGLVTLASRPGEGREIVLEIAVERGLTLIGRDRGRLRPRVAGEIPAAASRRDP